MRVSPYVAIVIGSKNMLMKVYEISAAKGIRTIDEIRYEYERILQERSLLPRLKKYAVYQNSFNRE